MIRYLLLTATFSLLLPGCQVFDRLRSGNKQATTLQQAADLQFAIARSLEQQGKPQQAVDAYRKVIDHDPGRSDALLRLAILHDQLGFPRDAAEFYHRALQADPGNPEIFADYGYSQYLHGNWFEAETNLRQALAIQPNHRRAFNNLALVLARTGRTEEALAAFRRGGCSMAEAHANVAFARVLEQDWDSAHRHYQLSCQADPASPLAKRTLKELEDLMARQQPGRARGSDSSSEEGVVPASWASPARP
jgi:Flp pilus assembly protein TadD